jgi:SOS response regulatory protein OraA/RecX
MPYRITSADSLLNLAMYYCSKRETSRARLGLYLKRKCREQKIDDSISQKWISDALDKCEESKMVDDKRYSEILIRDYTGRGKGHRYVEQKLREKGIQKDLRAYQVDEQSELERALALANKSIDKIKNKMSRKTKPDSRYVKNESFELKQKMMQKLITSGFSLEISKKAVEQIMTSLTMQAT